MPKNTQKIETSLFFGSLNVLSRYLVLYQNMVHYDVIDL